MDAQTIISKVYSLINEADSSTFIDEATTYELLNAALREVVRRTQLFIKQSTINILAGQASYTLSYDFLKFFARSTDDYAEPVIYYKNNKISYIDYGTYLGLDKSVTAKIPTNYTLNFNFPRSAIRGLASSNATPTNGEVRLTDIAQSFKESIVGGTVHLTHAGTTYNGYIVEYVSPTTLIIATQPSIPITVGDGYVISPPPTNMITFYPTPSEDFDLDIYYYHTLPPIYSPYRSIPIPQDLLIPVACYICWLYKYKDREPAYGDKYFMIFEAGIRRYAPIKTAEYRPQIKWQWKKEV